MTSRTVDEPLDEPVDRPAALVPRVEDRRWLMLTLLVIGQFMALLDATIVNVAMPTISHDLHPTGADLELIISGYTIAYAMLLVTGARLGDIFGSRRVFVLGMWVFTLASLACGLANDTVVLIAARFVQGAGAAAMVPQILSVIQQRFTGADRAKAVGIYGGTLAVGAVTGQVLGGVLVEANLFGSGWRPAFLVNVPVGVVVALLVMRVVPETRAGQGRRVDVAGLLTASAGVLLLVLPLVLGREQGWPWWTWVAMIAGAALLAAFAVVEGRVKRAGGDPLLDTAVLRTRAVPSGLVALAAGMVAYGGFLFTLALHLQIALGKSPLVAGLTFAPAAATFGLMGYNARRVPAALQPFLVPAGFAVASLGYVAVALLLRGGGDGGVALLIVLAVTGVGMGAAFSPTIGRALVHVPVTRAPDASGVLATVIQLSQVIGVTVLGSVFFSLTDSSTSAHAVAVVMFVAAGLSVVGFGAAVALTRAAAAPPSA